MRPRVEIPFALSVAAMAGCLAPDGGIDTTQIDLSTGDAGTTAADTGSSGAGIMTTTVELETASESGATVGAPDCGDGTLQEGEACDDGPANADDAACTRTCALATCGDGLIYKDREACDDGASNGEYGHCDAACAGPGPRCGDGELQVEFGETCEDPTPTSGCLEGTCTQAASCMQLKDAWQEQATDGVYTIHRAGAPLQVYCAMGVDDGAYTFLKVAAPEPMVLTAAQAETACAAYDMRLFVPRKIKHLEAAVEVAMTAELAPLGGGTDLASPQAYLGILGIYPDKTKASCPGSPLNSVDCPEWTAGDGGPYWLTDVKLSDTEPSAKACAGCSMAYGWNETLDPPVLDGYQVPLNGQSATSTHVLCDPGDWTGQAT